MPELVFFSGTMDCGKSTLALQIEHNRSARGLQGMIFTRNDRAGEGLLSSRLGLVAEAVEVAEDLDFHAHLVKHLTAGGRTDYVIVDEAQFLSPEQVEQLARVVDDLGLDVYAFGIATDFRTRLFPGSQRLMELADRTETLQVESLCWCGARATHNARTVGGRMVVEGAQVVVGDVGEARAEVGYEVLCRRHHRRRLTAAAAGAGALSPDVLPVDGGGPAGGAPRPGPSEPSAPAPGSGRAAPPPRFSAGRARSGSH
ncbi:thymidine kinase [Streptomyces boncukensis]|uniref:Thymidine kinase n=1 Tax=Streptomyces boncukensis TaxID=2711219 RepID=A0A6G4X511_9ACTN|nr:thymidine kinase [Streptomyces boncukensis]NGO72626.1 thymidine kinase [Streptomyces boncukensis]